VLVVVLCVVLVCLGTPAADGAQTTTRQADNGVLQVPKGDDVVQPSWSANGRALIFGLDNRAANRLHVYIAPIGRNATLRDLTPAAGRAGEPTWSPDGRRIAYVSFDPAVGKNDLYVIRPDGTGRRLLARAAREPSWSPNSRNIVFWVENYSGKSKLEVVTTKGGVAARIHLARQYYLRSPFWSPSGTEIAFTANGGRGPTYVISMRATPHVLARTPLAGGTWSHDWRHVAYVAKNGSLYVAAFPFRHPVRLTHGRYDSEPRWSPDDRFLAFTRSHSDFKHRSLFIVQANGRGIREVVRAG
jgi:Tol biopolymer transport system component